MGFPLARTHWVLGYCSGVEYIPSALIFLLKPTPSFLGYLRRIDFLRTSQKVWCPLRLFNILVSSKLSILAFSPISVVVFLDERLLTTFVVEDILRDIWCLAEEMAFLGFMHWARWNKLLLWSTILLGGERIIFHTNIIMSHPQWFELLFPFEKLICNFLMIGWERFMMTG